MRKFLIAAHGTLAEGAQSSLRLIMGDIGNLFTIQAYIDENKSIDDKLKLVQAQLKEEDELIVFTDLAGGSITNQVMQFFKNRKVSIIAGFNLPLLLDVILGDTEMPADELIEESIARAKEQIIYVNRLMNTENQ